MTDDINGWTLPTLRTYVLALLDERDRRYEQRFTAQEQAVNVAITSAQTATDKAEATLDKRIASVNEFRGQLADQAATLMPRNEAQVMFDQARHLMDRNRDDIALLNAKTLTREYYDTEHDALVQRVGTLEASTHDLLSRAEFATYQSKQQEDIIANRRVAVSSYVAVGLAILGMVVTIVLFLAH